MVNSNSTEIYFSITTTKFLIIHLTECSGSDINFTLGISYMFCKTKPYSCKAPRYSIQHHLPNFLTTNLKH